MTGKEMGQKMLAAVKSYCERSFASIRDDVAKARADIEDMVKAIPAGPKGEKGDPGIGEKGEPGQKGGPGEKGETGAVGKSAYALACDAGFIGSESQWVASLRGEKGLDGKDGTDGEDGLDALEIEPIVGIDETKHYMRGTWAVYRGGMFRAYQTTDGMKGWECMFNGIAEEKEEALDDGRTIKRTTVYSDGREMVREFRNASVIYREIFRDVEKYWKGDSVTYAGSLWIAMRDAPEGKPDSGNGHWKLAVKKGRDGKDGISPPAKVPVKL